MSSTASNGGKPVNRKSSTASNVEHVKPKVAIRLRPGNNVVWLHDTDKGRIFEKEDSSSKRAFDGRFDKVAPGHTSNEDLYNEFVHNEMIIDGALVGKNSMVLLYGQTGSGKTHTAFGTNNDPGMVQRAIKDVFKHANEDKESKWMVEMEVIEIHNEKAYDLLSTNEEKKEVDVKQRKERFFAVRGASRVTIASEEEVEARLQEVQKRRATGSTAMNALSSRSHLLVAFDIRQEREPAESTKENSASVEVTKSRLVFADLAGSERLKKTKAEGDRAKEGREINKSLSCLRNICSGRTASVRDSLLTKVLHPNLHGNAKAAVITCISPSEEHLDESKNSLEFASDCRKRLKFHVVKNKTLEAPKIKEPLRPCSDAKKPLSGNKRGTQETGGPVRKKRHQDEKLKAERAALKSREAALESEKADLKTKEAAFEAKKDRHEEEQRREHEVAIEASRKRQEERERKAKKQQAEHEAQIAERDQKLLELHKATAAKEQAHEKQLLEICNVQANKEAELEALKKLISEKDRSVVEIKSQIRKTELFKHVERAPLSPSASVASDDANYNPHITRVIMTRAGRASFVAPPVDNKLSENVMKDLSIPREIAAENSGSRTSSTARTAAPSQPAFDETFSTSTLALAPQWSTPGRRTATGTASTPPPYASPRGSPPPTGGAAGYHQLSLTELQVRKKELKQQLKEYDMNFACEHGRMPVKSEKEPIRHLYENYNSLKSQIQLMEQEGQHLPPPVVQTTQRPSSRSMSTEAPSQDIAALSRKAFFREHKRQVSSLADSKPVASQYRRHKEIKRAIATLQQQG